MQHTRRQQCGGALLTVLIIVMLVGIVLVAYLTMLSSQHTASARSLAWNTAMPMAEAGIEEALAHLNYSGTTNLESDGWVKTNNQYVATRPLANGYAQITISTDAAPTIVSKGYVQAPVQSSFISRTVQVQTRKRSPFPGAFTAKGSISMSGGIVDSFDSSDALYSTGGAYDASKHKDNGKIQSASGAAGSVAVGNAIVYGRAATGPGGTVTIGSSGYLGDTAWDSNIANKGKIEPGFTSSDVNLTFEDVTPPYTNGYSTPAVGAYTYSGSNYTYKLDSGNYGYVGNLSIPGGGSMVVTGKCVLYVMGTFTISGSGFLYIAPSGSLELYVGGSSATISGGGVGNGTLTANNFSIKCLPACTKVTYSGSAQFIGTIYAPQADLTMSGSAAAVGAAVAGTIVASGGMSMHYDEALGGGDSKYIVTGWTEL